MSGAVQIPFPPSSKFQRSNDADYLYYGIIRHLLLKRPRVAVLRNDYTWHAFPQGKALSREQERLAIRTTPHWFSQSPPKDHTKCATGLQAPVKSRAGISHNTESATPMSKALLANNTEYKQCFTRYQPQQHLQSLRKLFYWTFHICSHKMSQTLVWQLLTFVAARSLINGGTASKQEGQSAKSAYPLISNSKQMVQRLNTEK